MVSEKKKFKKVQRKNSTWKYNIQIDVGKSDKTYTTTTTTKP